MAAPKRIGDLLVDAGVIGRVDLERVIARRPGLQGHRLLSELYLLGLVPERPLAEALARHLGVPVVVLTETAIDLAAVRLVPEAFIRDRLALPVAADARTLTLATPDPDTPNLTEPIAFATGKRVIPVLALSGVLGQLIDGALEASARGRHVLPGGPQAAASPHVVMATHTPSRAEADALARSIIDAIDAAPPATGAQLGAVRLKRVLVERAAAPEPALEIVEKVRAHVVEAEAPSTFDEVTASHRPLSPASAEAGPASALVVDDDEKMRALLQGILEGEGFEVHAAATGEEAVAFLRQRRPSVVLLDGMLPGIHGFEICAAMKQSEVLATLPVVMISAVYRGWEFAREITELHGADYFVEKPFDVHYLRRVVAELVKRPATRPPRAADVAERVEGARMRFEHHIEQGLWFAASADVEIWLSLDPFDGRAWLERGNVCVQAGDLVGAMAAYEAATLYGHELLSAYLGLAFVSEQLGFVRRARGAWTKARALAPDEGTRARIDAHLGAA